MGASKEPLIRNIELALTAIGLFFEPGAVLVIKASELRRRRAKLGRILQRIQVAR
jgi:hypothetical protein